MRTYKQDRRPEIKDCKTYKEFVGNTKLYQWAYRNDLVDWARTELNATPRKSRSANRAKRARKDYKPEIIACRTYTEFRRNGKLYGWARYNGLLDWARATLKVEKKPIFDSNGDKPLQGLKEFIRRCEANGLKSSVSNEEYLHHDSITNCECCGDSFENIGKCLDHNHKTGKYRGTLCVRCNLAEGHVFGSVERAYKLLQYISERN